MHVNFHDPDEISVGPTMLSSPGERVILYITGRDSQDILGLFVTRAFAEDLSTKLTAYLSENPRAAS